MGVLLLEVVLLASLLVPVWVLGPWLAPAALGVETNWPEVKGGAHGGA
jgi:hypothetical protein